MRFLKSGLKITLLLLSLVSLSAGMLRAQSSIAEFISVPPLDENQTENLLIPATHTFQILVRAGDTLTLGGNEPPNFDFTAFLPTDLLGNAGLLSINHELEEGAVTTHLLHFDFSTFTWKITESAAINFSAVGGIKKPCSGGITSWGTVIAGEETLWAGDNNDDGYSDFGWLVEFDPFTRRVIDHDGDGQPDKMWKAGRIPHENACLDSIGSVLYTGGDHGVFGFLLKFVPDIPGDFSSGKLYGMRRTGSNGQWILLPNATPAQCSLTPQFGAMAGLTNFNGIEDVEIGPAGLIYFSSKGHGQVYRFRDEGATVSRFETYVGGMDYEIDYGRGKQVIHWGMGNDNLAFDGEGNLWVCQDGDHNHIWVVHRGHTQSSPRVSLFGRTPAGCEPTGINFSPDYRFLFISFQHPSSANQNLQADCNGRFVKFDRDCAVVIARDENLGQAGGTEGFYSLNATLDSTFVSRLDWSLAFDAGDEWFTVERSLQGKPFTGVALVRGEKFRRDYTFYDQLPGWGHWQYRIRYARADGSSQYSPVASVFAEYEGALEMDVYPVPAVDEVTVNLRAKFEQPGTLSLIDMQGRAVHSVPVTVFAGSSISLKLDVTTVGSGYYTLQFKNKWGGKVQRQILIQ